MVIPSKTITSDFAILDVKKGRQKMAAHFEQHQPARIPVVITGYINGIWGHDDGTSQEFTLQVTSIT